MTVFKIYILLFLVLLVSNLFFHFKYKMKLVFFVYEIFSAIYMILVMVAYWNPLILERLNIVSIIPLIFILAIDIYFSIWGKVEDLGLKIPGLSTHEQETAKIISILFTAPAYIVGLLLVFELVGTQKLFIF
jgi:hypothetical protein